MQFFSKSLALFAVVFALGACASQTQSPMLNDAAGDGLATRDQATASAEPIAEPAPQMLPLAQSWKTNYAGFVQAPVEVLRLGLRACQQRGFEVATISTIGLDGDEATATFLCQGDVE